MFVITFVLNAWVDKNTRMNRYNGLLQRRDIFFIPTSRQQSFYEEIDQTGKINSRCGARHKIT